MRIILFYFLSVQLRRYFEEYSPQTEEGIYSLEWKRKHIFPCLARRNKGRRKITDWWSHDTNIHAENA
jgi:hypothetical protein